MASKPGRKQTSFAAGELDPRLHERTELKYFKTGCARAENLEFAPQGGFKLRDGLRHVGELETTAARLLPFRASDGEAYDLVFSDLAMEAWQDSELQSVVTPFTAAMLPKMTFAQQLDTGLVFHKDLETRRIVHAGSTSWSIDTAPFSGVPLYDYGGVYTNGVAAEWEIEFISLNGTSVFTLTISNEETTAITYSTSWTAFENSIIAAIEDLPSVSAGIDVNRTSGTKFRITFDGSGNEGDGWAVSGRVINKTDAAITSIKRTPGVAPGEDLISSTRGYARCGIFYQQRLIMGGFRSLPNSWIASQTGDYYNFDDRLDEANGSFLVPMDTPGGEALVSIAAMRNLLLFTDEAEYWLSERAVSKTTPPNHVEASRHGAAEGVPIVENEGAAIFANASGSTLGEFRYTDVDGNFIAEPLSLLCAHLVTGVSDLAVRRASDEGDGNILSVIQSDGTSMLGTLLRSQEVTAFGRVTSPGASFKATSCNGSNQLNCLVERSVNGSVSRRLERYEAGLLLDGAISFSYGSPTATITGLDIHEGEEVWAIGDDEVFGPFTVASNQITLPVDASEVTVGRWSPPVMTTLPPSREIGPDTVLMRHGRIHSVVLSLLDTTSIAISANGGPVYEIDLVNFGADADVPELQRGFTGKIHLDGLTGYTDDPSVTITQVRPGRLNLTAITLEAAL